MICNTCDVGKTAGRAGRPYSVPARLSGGRSEISRLSVGPLTHLCYVSSVGRKW